MDGFHFQKYPIVRAHQTTIKEHFEVSRLEYKKGQVSCVLLGA